MRRQRLCAAGTAEHTACDRCRARAANPRDRSEPQRIGDAACLSYRDGVVDNRNLYLGNEVDCGVERQRAEVGIADGVEDELMRWQRDRDIGIVGDQDRGQEGRVVEEQAAWDIAAA